MLELLQETVKGYNLPFTILLGVIILYWIVALFGLIDLDFSPDFDLDVDADGATGGDDAGSAKGGLMNALVKIVGLSDAPIILIVSVFSVLLWGLNIIANLVFNAGGAMNLAALLLLPVVVVSFVVMRLVVRPLRPLMEMMHGSEPDAQILGREGVVKSATITPEFGRVEITCEGKTLLLNAVLSTGSEELKKNARVLVVSQKETEETYIVRPL